MAGDIYGRGLAVASGGRCLVLTPSHVLWADGQRVAKVEVTNYGPINAPALVLAAPSVGGIGVLWVKNDGDRFCSARDRERRTPVPDSTRALVYREESGSITTRKVSLRSSDADEIVVTPSNPSEPLQGSMSGATLYLGKRREGMLVSVDTEGRGFVLPIPEVMRLSECRVYRKCDSLPYRPRRILLGSIALPGYGEFKLSRFTHGAIAVGAAGAVLLTGLLTQKEVIACRAANVEDCPDADIVYTRIEKYPYLTPSIVLLLAVNSGFAVHSYKTAQGKNSEYLQISRNDQFAGRVSRHLEQLSFAILRWRF